MADEEDEFGAVPKETTSSAPPPAAEPPPATVPTTPPPGSSKIMSKMAIYEQIAAQAKAKTKGGSSFTPSPAALAAAALATASTRMTSDSLGPSPQQPTAPPSTPNMVMADAGDGGLAARASAQRIADLERQLEAKEKEIESAKQKAMAYVQVSSAPATERSHSTETLLDAHLFGRLWLDTAMPHGAPLSSHSPFPTLAESQELLSDKKELAARLKQTEVLQQRDMDALKAKQAAELEAMGAKCAPRSAQI